MELTTLLSSLVKGDKIGCILFVSPRYVVVAKYLDVYQFSNEVLRLLYTERRHHNFLYGWFLAYTNVDL
jgi:hypothetical protein